MTQSPPRAIRRLACILLALAASPACVMSPRGPEFKRSVVEHPFPIAPALYHAGALDVQVDSGSATEVRFVYGSEQWTVRLYATLANTGPRAITVAGNSGNLADMLGAFRPGVPYPASVVITDATPQRRYLREAVLQPGERAEVVLGIAAGTAHLEKPVALVYRDVRMELRY